MKEKVNLKHEYKKLVRSGDSSKAQKVLEKIWKLCGIVKNTITPKKYTKEELESKSFFELRKIGYKVGTKGRGKEELVKEILELQ